MCAPGISLNLRERIELRNEQRILMSIQSVGYRDMKVTSFNHDFGSVQMNMRRLERLGESLTGDLAEAQSFVLREAPVGFNGKILQGFFPSVRGIWERNAPSEMIQVPEGYRLAGIAEESSGRGFLITVGQSYLEALKAVNHPPSIPFYERALRLHGGRNPRVPVILKTTETSDLLICGLSL